MRRRRVVRIGLAVALLASLAVPLPAGAATPKIEHLVVLMQENHTFDNYFGTFPGADGIPAAVCMPLTRANGAPCTKPFHNTTPKTSDPDHSRLAALAAYNGGKMDGFGVGQTNRNLDGVIPMGYWDGRDLPLYWNLATDYVLADRFFSSAWGASQSNHMFWIAAQSGGSQGVPPKGYSIPTIFDRLEAAGVSWKMYIQNYDPTQTFRAPPPYPPQIIWAPLLSFPRFLDTPALHSKIVDLSQYYKDLAAGTLPAVSYIVPASGSEHPPGNVTAGQQFGAAQVTALMRSSSWWSSMFVLLYDDWGGYYDHVPPPQVDADGYGFRVPAMFISPYISPGTIDHTVYDFTSILRYIEVNWKVAPLTKRDATATSIGQALNLNQAAAAPRFPQSVYPPRAVPDSGNRVTLLIAYGVVSALLLLGLLAALLAVYLRRDVDSEVPA